MLACNTVPNAFVETLWQNTTDMGKVTKRNAIINVRAMKNKFVVELGETRFIF